MLHRRRPGRPRRHRDLDGCAQLPGPQLHARRYAGGDGVLFYHSSCAVPGIAGLAQVASSTRTDPTQFDPESPYYDPTSAPDQPRWLLLDVQALRKTRLLGLPELRNHPDLAALRGLQRGNRLSITPVEAVHWAQIVALLA